MFIGDRSLVVFDSNDDVAELDVQDPMVAAFCLAVKPAVITPDPTGSAKADTTDECPAQARYPGTEEDQDGPGW
ncbi:hypothetical protein [Cypionkella psychrotolerans]|uniref:hypothetical protein n=1 Tax=Cypionkella psychrotolerans TaxID=1678131 RepID=UPI0006B50B2A|nr:hypothetical protein [Cypionkella psychrotolerans]